MADGTGPSGGHQLRPVEGDQLVDAEAGAGGHGDGEVVAGVIVRVGDAEDGVDVVLTRDYAAVATAHKWVREPRRVSHTSRLR